MFLKKIKGYLFPFILLCSVILGSVCGSVMGTKAVVLKPFGDVFLNLMFTVVIPLIFFSISSAICAIGEAAQLWKVLSRMLVVFIFTGVIAAVFMLFVVKIYPPGLGVVVNLTLPTSANKIDFATELVNMFTVNDFYFLFSKGNILALIVFSILVGFSASHAGEKGKWFGRFLLAGTEVSMKAVSFVMYYAPIGFFAYFAVLVGQLGPQLLTTYFRATVAYYPAALIYFIVAYSFYAYLAAQKTGVIAFWKNVFLPGLTALATCSSAASIPANLQATQKIGVPAEIFETVVPLGGIIHKDGSTLAGMVKIAFLFGVFHLHFSGVHVILEAIFVAVMVGTVMGAIPSGGMVGEMLILSVYGFPPQSLLIIAAISIIVDPPATLLNVTGNTVCSMLVARLTKGKNWLSHGE